MPPEIFGQVLAATHAIMKKYFNHVDSAIEAPGKTTFGDVDVQVLGPLDPTFDSAVTHIHVVAENIAKALGAKKWIKEKGQPTINFAIPWPRVGTERTPEEKYIQLDIKICHSRKVFQWELFHAAHGDLWNILGTTIRRFGLTVNDRGMFLRIPDIEMFDRKKSMIFLTDEPNTILEFLGLDAEKWWKPFPSRMDMFEYAAGCRMFWVKEVTAEGEAEGDVFLKDGALEGQEGGLEGKKKLKHNDRQRMSKRPIFREWIDEFIPKCRDDGRLGNTTITREQIRDDAFTTFRVQEEYERRLQEWKLAKHKDDLWRDAIKGCVPEDVDPQFRAASIKTLKLIIMEGEAFDGAVPKAAQKDNQGFYDVEEVRKFVSENWKRAGEIGWARQQVQAMESMKAKAEKKRLEQETKSKNIGVN